MNKRPLVAGIGELLWDMLPAGKQLGGAPCNFAFHAMQSGCDSFVISAIGEDEPGRELIQTINHLGISEKYIQRNGYPTSTVSIELDHSGHPDYTIHENVAWDHIEWNEEISQLAGRLDAICFGSLAQRDPESRSAIISLISAVSPDCLRVFDINLRQHYFEKDTIFQSILLSDVLKLNEDELPVLAGYLDLSGNVRTQIEQIIAYFNLKYVVYTLGSNGSIIANATEYSYIPAPKVNVADTVGAGDAFTAVFTTGILMGLPISRVHSKASEIAALVCTEKGATPKLSTQIF